MASCMLIRITKTMKVCFSLHEYLMKELSVFIDDFGFKINISLELYLLSCNRTNLMSWLRLNVCIVVTK